MLTRATERDVVRLMNAVQRRKATEDTISELITRLRGDDVPWSFIASCLGVTKQAAQQRYGS